VCIYWYLAIGGGMAAAVAGAWEADVPLVVHVLAGNTVTSAHILACLDTDDATRLRCLHPAVCVEVADVPWCYTDTPVVDAVRWRACFPAAIGARLTDQAVEGLLASEPAVAALAGVVHLNLQSCTTVPDELLLRLPTSLHTLNVRFCFSLTAAASFAHLTALTSLDCSCTQVVKERTDGLPPSLQELDISSVCELRPGASLAHLHQLRVLRADRSRVDLVLASLPPSLEELHAAHCERLTPAASFAHLIALRVLDVAESAIGDALMVTLPPSLVSLNARECDILTSAATLPHLPALRLLDVRNTAIGDAFVGSLPASLVELQLTWCRGVTASARLDHLHALRMLHCSDTELAPAVLDGCCERGCVVVASTVLRGHDRFVITLAVLSNGQLASGDEGGTVRLWDVARGGEATAVLDGHDGSVNALAALPGGSRLAAGVSIGPFRRDGFTGIVVWDTGVVPPTRCATLDCGSGVCELAVLRDGRLAAGCGDGGVRLMEMGAGTVAVTATLEGHEGAVTALAVLPDGTLASGTGAYTVRLWDVGAQACVATMAGRRTYCIYALAVLADGRLASASRESRDGNLRLWDVATRACVGELEGHTGRSFALAALPDGRLASGSRDHTIRVWDTRPAAAAGTGTAAAAASGEGTARVMVLEGHEDTVYALHPLPDGRLASGSRDKTVRLWRLPPS